MKQALRKIVQRQAHVVEAVGQAREDVRQFAATRGFVRRKQLIIGASNLFVKLNIWRREQTASLSVLVKNSGDEERIVSNVRTEQKCLLRRRAAERNEHVGDVFVRPFADFVRALKLAGARKRFQKRTDIVGKFPITDPGLLQDVTGQDVKIELRRDVQLSGVGKDCFDQKRMIENAIARFGV